MMENVLESAPSGIPSAEPSSFVSRLAHKLDTKQDSLSAPQHIEDMIQHVLENVPSSAPSDNPSLVPSIAPTQSPSQHPSKYPTSIPSQHPSEAPTSIPSISPSDKPSNIPSEEPSGIPSQFPSHHPTSIPSISPSDKPSNIPSEEPSGRPSQFPSHHPTSIPSLIPSLNPTTSPSISPSELPSFSSKPSLNPSLHPSSSPSIFPSNGPSQGPSTSPSSSPTVSSEPSGTMGPSSQPSTQPTMSVEPTYIREPTYWTYNPKSEHGPDDWGKVGKGDLFFQDIGGDIENMCGKKFRRQSPIILKENTACKDDHQVFTQRGNFNFDELEFMVLPHTLRVMFPKDKGWAARPPRSDFSNLSNIIPAGFMDVKIPSEHQIEDELGVVKAYPGEIQLYHDWGEKVVIIAFFFDYEEDEHNEQFEDFIRKWEDIHSNRTHECENKNSTIPYIPKFVHRTETEMREIWGDHEGFAGNADYDIYRLQPTVYYYGYRGSSTAPPCGDNVWWRIQDIPMKISHDQFLRVRNVILDQRDANCKRISKAYNGGVNRPIQNFTNSVWRCDARHWKVRYPSLWCGKWPKNYHGGHRLKGHCPEFS